ncbi:MAG: Ig-like domain-containing protein [Ignavibacteriales bacterium]|nr:Ig-like domain-containing protein [Ignavibacteriales bacterium]
MRNNHTSTSILKRFSLTCAFFLSLMSSLHAQQWISSYKEAIQNAGVIVTASVGKLQSEWIEDARGKHIYTHVGLRVMSTLKGETSGQDIVLTVIGGTVGDITEEAIPSPTFKEGEQCMVLLQQGGNALVSGEFGKIEFGHGVAYCENMVVSIDALTQAVEEIIRTPALHASLREVLEQKVLLSTLPMNSTPRQSGLQDAAPVISSITPPKASSGTSTLVTIKGKNFLTAQSSGNVTFYDVTTGGTLGEITAWSDTQIVCVVPGEGMICSGPLVVTNGNGVKSNDFNFLVSFSYRQMRWPGLQPVVKYFVNPNAPDSTGLIAAVNSAAATWNKLGSAMTLKYGGTHTSTASSFNGVNEVLWGEPLPGATASVLIWHRGADILETDMTFSSKMSWTTNGNGTSTVDVQAIALHEFGHFIVLGDLYGRVGDGINDDAKTMGGGADSVSTTLRSRSVFSDDAAGSLWTYGPPGSMVPAPVIAPSSFSNQTPLSIKMFCSSPDVTIRYSTDGSEPTALSDVYYVPISLNAYAGGTIKAKGFKDGWVASPTTSIQLTSAMPQHKPQFTLKLRDTSIVANQNFTFTYRASDSNNDTLVYSLVNAPSGSSLTKTGMFTWTPSYKQWGSFLITAVVSDGRWTDTARATITVTKVNLKPTIISRTPAVIAQSIMNKSVTFGVSASDQNGDALAYTWRVNGLTEKSGLDSTFSRMFSGTAGDAENVICIATDPGGLKDSTIWSFTLITDTVLAPPASWAFRSKTGRTCTIAAYNGMRPTIGTRAFRSGDAVGAFFQRNDSLICGGYGTWQAQSTINPQAESVVITMWGDDDQTTMKDGFAEGENIIFKIWDSRAGVEYKTSAAWKDPYAAGPPQNSTFSTNAVYMFYQLETVLNGKPSFVSKLGNVTVAQNQTLSFTYTATDPNNDAVTFSLVNPPVGASITTLGVFNWKPTTSQLGGYSIIAVVSDGSLTDTALATVTVKMLNVKPTFVLKMRDTSVVQNQTLSFAYTASDANNDTLRYSLVNPPPGATITTAGVFSWKPTTTQLGAYSIVAVVSDGLLADTTQAKVAVKMLNVKPTFVSKLQDTTVVQNQTLTFTFMATDPNGDTLRFNLVNPPSGATLTPLGVFSWKPTSDQIGVHPIVIMVSDGALADTARSTVTVTGMSVPSSWSYGSNTGKNCTIAINTSIDPKIGSQAFRMGDAVGVFYKRNDSLICGGYAVWMRQNAAITAWGDDSQTSIKDGFSEGEALTFKVWDSKGGKIFDATVQFSQGTPTYTTNGLCILSSLVASTAVFVEDQNPVIPGSFILYQNYPNPFNPATYISYAVGDRSSVLMEVFDMLGRRVAVLVDGIALPGVHTVRWDATSSPSGVYTYRLRAGELTQSRRMTLMK